MFVEGNSGVSRAPLVSEVEMVGSTVFGMPQAETKKNPTWKRMRFINIRIQKKLTQRDLSKILDISQPTINRYEKGLRAEVP